MENIAVVVIALAIGLFLQHSKRMPENSSAALNAYVIYVALPALVLLEIPKLTFNHAAVITVIAAWVIMLFAACVTWWTARAMSWSREVTGAMMLLVTLGNTGFVGIPLIEAHLGAKALPYAILYDQLGTFIALNTLGIGMAGYYSSRQGSAREIVRNILAFPPFIALILAFLVGVFWVYPAWLEAALGRISSTLVPVVMVAVGLQWQLSLKREYFSPLLLGLFFMLILTPAFTWFGLWLFEIDGLVARVILLESAMPAMISAGVLAATHHLAPRLAASLVGYSLLLGLLSVWVWRLLI
jgi:predicted permease